MTAIACPRPDCGWFCDVSTDKQARRYQQQHVYRRHGLFGTTCPECIAEILEISVPLFEDSIETKAFHRDLPEGDVMVAEVARIHSQHGRFL